MATGEHSAMAPGEHGAATAARLARLSALSRALRRALVECRDELEIYANACRAAVEVGPFRFAWIGVPDVGSAEVRPVADAGAGAGYLEAIRIALDGVPEAYGPTATALREQHPVVCADIATDPNMAPWREAALARGFRSSGAFPFVHRGTAGGTLNVYAPEPGFADPLEQYLLEGIAEDIGLALEALDRERARADAEARLAESERLHRAIFEHASDGIFIADGATHRYLDANPAGCALLGYTREELCALTIEQVIAPDDLAARPVRLDEKALGVSFFSERRLVRKDGRPVDVEIHGVRLADGTLESVVRDVSERKRTLMERAATERMASLGRLAQGVGHEINNPLSYLALSLGLMRTLLVDLPPALRADLEEPLGHAEDGAERIARIVRALATFGRGDAESLAAVSLARAVDAALALTAHRMKHVATVEVDVGAAPAVLGNEFQLTQVFVNLLLNAADAMEEVVRKRHVVRIAARPRGDDEVVVEVADTGPGIAASERERIFDPFYTTKAIGRGTGLGLSICRGIVGAFGGALEVDEAAGGGALFRVVLRVAEPARVEAAGRSVPEVAGRLRVLVIDDEPLIARNLARTLHAHDVTVLDAPGPALELCRREDFDRIFCDLMFPSGSAEPFYEALVREKPALARRVVFMTGGAFTVAMQSFVERSGRTCLIKPFTAEELRAALVEG